MKGQKHRKRRKKMAPNATKTQKDETQLKKMIQVIQEMQNNAKDAENLWKLAAEEFQLDGQVDCDKDCTGRKSPFCVCYYRRENQGRRKGIWKKDEDLLIEFGEDPSLYERKSRSYGGQSTSTPTPTGLKNLGATCYANSVLQCLFNALSFRRDMLNLPLGESKVDNNNTDSQMIIEGIHKIFAEMQFGPKGIVNPEYFLTQVLELKGNVQQDCQEFWTLLHYSIEGGLQCMNNKSLGNILKQNFVGQNSYQTVCSKCKNFSESSQKLLDFQVLELDVKENASLESSLETYLAEEILDGENQYVCVNCKSRQNAVRSIKLHTLPPHLILQLKRFKFDLKTYERKKIKSSFKFPLSVDLGPYLTKERGSKKRPKLEENVYDIESIILHRGKSAAEGHYVSLSKREEDGLWWEFDDQNVTCVGSTLDEHNSFSKAKVEEGYLLSTQVYIMVYKQRQKESVKKATSVPMDILHKSSKKMMFDLIDSYKAAKLNFNLKKQEFMKRVAEKRSLVTQFLDLASKKTQIGNAKCVSAEYLAHWTSSLENVPDMDLKDSLCCHKLIDPAKIGSLKVVSSDAWALLKKEVKISPVLSSGMLCKRCLEENFVSKLKKFQLQKENVIMLQKYREYLSGTLGDMNSTYLVSKKWLQKWLRNSKFQFALKESPTLEIVCEHGKLSPDSTLQNSCQIVPGEVWEYISRACSTLDISASELNSADSICDICGPSESSLSEPTPGLSGILKRKLVTLLKDIVHKSPVGINNKEVYYIIPLNWFFIFQSALVAKPSDEHLVDILSDFAESMNKQLDRHDKLQGKLPRFDIYKLQDKRNVWKQKICNGNSLILSSDTWNRLSALVKSICEVDIKGIQIKLTTPSPLKSTTPQLELITEYSDCHSEYQQDLKYKNGKIWIYGSFSPVSERSTRKRKEPIEFTVNGDMSLGELKEKIRKLGPMCGAIYYCQGELKDDNSSLSALNILPGDVLTFDNENKTASSYSSDANSMATEEKSFKGTRLYM